MSMRTRLRKFWTRWREFARYVGDFQARLILTFFYFTVMLPFALLARFVIDPLHIRWEAGSGWTRREPLSSDLVDARRLF